ncbi:MAG: LysR family transcriptional regulator [Armatimonadetes bacterium]|nr:LysR family transcriptional regulator [Armatimonadota bacterium]MDE2205146.1 LysR family transcriptional regulator [Armatimonadota bacterium]
MELRDLKLFCKLVETRSFTKTAAASCVTQSAVSQRIQALEEELKQALLIRRRGRGAVGITDAGQALYDDASHVVAGAEQILERFRSSDSLGSSQIRVATVYSVGLHALPPRIKPFLLRNPDLKLHLEYSRTDRVYEAVLAGSTDVGIVACPSARQGVEIRSFGLEEMALVCPPEHELSHRHHVGLSDLGGRAYVAFAADIPTRRLVDERLAAAGVLVKVVAELENVETIKNLIEIGAGVALLPEVTVRREVRAGDLCLVPLAETDRFARPTGALLLASRFRSRAVQAFLKEVCSQQPALPD